MLAFSIILFQMLDGYTFIFAVEAYGTVGELNNLMSRVYENLGGHAIILLKLLAAVGCLAIIDKLTNRTRVVASFFAIAVPFLGFAINTWALSLVY